MADPTTPDAPTEPDPHKVAPELGDLIRVVFKGNAAIGDQTEVIKLQPGPSGEDRTLQLGGSPQDALVTLDELNMLTSKFEIEISEEQPKLAPEEIEAQMPGSAEPAGEAVTLPNENPDAEAPEEEIAATPPAQPEGSDEEAAAEAPAESPDQPSAGEKPAQPAAQPGQPSGQTPSTPAVPSPPQQSQQGPQAPAGGPPQTPPAEAPGQSSPTTTAP